MFTNQEFGVRIKRVKVCLLFSIIDIVGYWHVDSVDFQLKWKQESYTRVESYNSENHTCICQSGGVLHDLYLPDTSWHLPG